MNKVKILSIVLPIVLCLAFGFSACRRTDGVSSVLSTDGTGESSSTPCPATLTTNTTATTAETHVSTTATITTVGQPTTTAPHKHQFYEASCNGGGFCFCGARGEPLGHYLIDGVCTRRSCTTNTGYRTEGVAEGTNWSYGQCVLAGTMPLYTYTDEPGKLFCYKGKTTDTISVVGKPTRMFVDAGTLCYHDEGTSDLYMVDVRWKINVKKFFSAPGTVYEFFRLGSYAYIAADDEQGNECLYTRAIYISETEKLLDTDNDRMRLLPSKDYVTCLFGDGSVYTVEYGTNKVTQQTEKNYVIDTQSYRVEGVDDFRYPADVLEHPAKESTIYRAKKLAVGDEYYLPVRRESSADGAEDYWVFDTAFTHIIRVNEARGARQVIAVTPSGYQCGSLAVNRYHLLCIIGDTESDARYTYLMNSDGSNIRCIGARVNGKVLVGEEAKQAAAALTAALQATGAEN